MWRWIEPAFHGAFSRVGVEVSRRPRVIALATVIALVAVSLGIIGLETEYDVANLWIKQRGRIHREKKFFEDNFGDTTPRLSAFIIKSKDGSRNLLRGEVLDEIQDLQRWIRDYAYKPKGGDKDVSLEQICYKTLDREPQEPCFHYSILDCFREGSVFNVGGDFNSKYGDIYSPRRSYNQFRFEEDFTEDYFRQQCVQWTNVGTSDSMLLGEIRHGRNSRNQKTIESVGAIRIAFGTKTPAKLAEDGLTYIRWEEKSTLQSEGSEICRDADGCDACIDELDLDDAARAGCIPAAVEQPESCCAMLGSLRKSPCVELLFEKKPEIKTLGNIVLGACNLPTVELNKRCSNEELISGAFEDKRSMNEEDKSTPGSQDEPPVCVCLTDSAGAECGEAGAHFVRENQQWLNVFLAAKSGDDAARAEVGRILVREVGCADPRKTERDTLPAVCKCLMDSQDPQCRSGGLELIQERPDLQAIFAAAAGGDEAAKAQVAKVLLEDIGCLGSRRATRGLLDAHEEEGTPRVADMLKLRSTAHAEAKTFKANAVVDFNLVRTESKAEELLHEWELAWQRDIEEKVLGYQHIKVSWIASSTLDDTSRRAGKAQAPLLLVGYGVVLIYVMAFFSFEWCDGKIRFSSTPPGPMFAALGFFSVLLGVAATFGVIGALSLSNMKASAITLQIVPLLVVGLGINDFFVLAASLKGAIHRNPSGPLEEIMADTMGSGGTSITLSSAANVAAFVLGALSPIPAVQWFSMHMAIGLVVAYLVSITIIPCILTWAMDRWLRGLGSRCLPCSKEGTQDTQDSGQGALPSPTATRASDAAEGAGVSGAKLATEPPEYASRVKNPKWHWVFNNAVMSVFAGLIAVSVLGITRLGQGLNASEAVPKDSHLYRYLKPSETYFQTFPVYVVFGHENDFSDLKVFQNARQAEFEFLANGYKTDTSQGVTSWMEYYTQYIEAKVCSNELCLSEVDWYWDGFSSSGFGSPQKDICRSVADPTECARLCEQHCPQGPKGSPFRCELGEDGRSCFCPWRPVPRQSLFYESPDEFSGVRSLWSDFLANTTGGAVSQNFINFDDSSITGKNPYGRPVASRSLAFVKNVPGVKEKLKHLTKGRDIIYNAPVDAFPFDYTVYGVGEQYNHLPHRTLVAVAISVAAGAIVMLPLIVHWFALVIITFCVVSSVTISAGMSHWLGLNLNYAVYVSLVVSVGISVEFCVHIIREFMLAPGSRCFRSAHALRHMGVAVLNGGITTLLGLLPVAFSEFPYFRKYFFAQYSLVVATGLFIGLGVLPVLLSLFGPRTYENHPSGVCKIPQRKGCEIRIPDVRHDGDQGNS